MANHKSSKKRIRQTIQRNLRNRATRSACHTAVKAVQNAVATNSENTEELFRKAEKTIATAGSKGIFHKKKVARKVSRLAKLVNKAKEAAQA